MVLTSLPKIDRCSPTNLKNDVEKREKAQWRNHRKVDVVKVDAENCKGFAQRQFI
jgi:hypothetical protein